MCRASTHLYLLFRLPAILLANCLLLCITSSRQSFQIPSLPLMPCCFLMFPCLRILELQPFSGYILGIYCVFGTLQLTQNLYS